MKKLVALSLLFLILLSSCKKYPDGPALSLRSKKERLSNTWHINKYYYNNEDKTGDAQYLFADYTLVINKNGTYSLSFHTKVYFLTVLILDTPSSESGKWAFNDDKSFVNFTPETSTNSNASSSSYKILMLKEKELHAQTIDSNGNKTVVYLKP